MSEPLNLSDYCDACQAIPRHGYCKLKGCPKPRPTPPRGGEAVTAAEDRGDGDEPKANEPRVVVREWLDMAKRQPINACHVLSTYHSLNGDA